jgi:hypothetical protein
MHDYSKLIAAGLVTSVLLVAACGSGSNGPGVAGAGTSTASHKGSALAYSGCMRSHGISDFPDPNGQGEIQLTATPGSDLTHDSAQFKAADKACRALLPTPSPAQQRKDFAQALKFAKCMRSHGIQIPDPQPPGSSPHTESHVGQGDGGQNFDPNSPQFKSAQQACASLLPKGKGGFSTHSVGGGGK